MTLRQKQSLLVMCLRKLFAFAERNGWEWTLGEAGVTNPRKVWITVPRPLGTGTGPSGGWGKSRRDDAEHMKGSLHYRRLAIDLNLFVNGRYIRSGNNPAYLKLGAYWEKLNPLCKWGGRFGDANHFSIGHGGKA